MRQHRVSCGIALLGIAVLGIFLCSDTTVAQRRTIKSPTGGTIVLVARNGPENAGQVAQFNTTFDTKFDTVNVGNNEGIALDNQGNLYQCGDGKAGPSIRVFARFAERANKGGVEFDANRDREIKGAKTTLKNPKGIDLDNKRGLIFVAENGNGTLLIFSSEAGGDVAPIANITLPAKPWDVEYDDGSDTLFVALVNGKCAVFDKFAFSGFSATPSRTIEPEGSVNLHGIAYDRAKDVLLLSDVGQANSNTDGKLFVIKTASKVYGPVKPARTIEGADTKLGNPVDIVWDGKDLYVAEKANDKLMVYRNFLLGKSGAVAADVIADDVKPEALILLTP
jgi:hypothetical protein